MCLCSGYIVMDQTGMTLSSWDLLPSRVSLWGGCSCPPMASDWLLSPQKREAFCQLLQLMKNKHSKQDEPDMISVFIGTWNMGQARVGVAVGARNNPRVGA